MYRLLLIFVVALSLWACKKTKPTVVTPSASLSGELHYRKLCTTGENAPIPASPQPIVYIANADGALVASPASASQGRFAINSIKNPGTFHLSVFSWGTTHFYANGATYESLPVSIPELKRYSIGKVCVDNDPPEISSLAAEYSVGITTPVDFESNRLHIPRSAGLIFLKGVATDPDGQKTAWQFYSTDGTLTSTQGLWSWDLSGVGKEQVVLHASANDGHGGQTDRVIEVRLYENLVFPKVVDRQLNFAAASDRSLMAKTAENGSGRWSFSQCCLVAAQYDPAVANTLHAVAPGVSFLGQPFTAETEVEIYSLNGAMRIGLRITDVTRQNHSLNAFIAYENGTASWGLGNGAALMVSGPLNEPLLGGKHKLSVSYDPYAETIDFWVTSYTGTVTGGTVSVAGEHAQAAFETAIHVENIASNASGASYIAFSHLAITGADPSLYQLPVRFGSDGTEMYNQGLYGENPELYVLTEHGEYAGAEVIELPLTQSLHRALVLTADGRKVTVLTDSEERLLAWLPWNATVTAYEPLALTRTADPLVFLY